MIIQGSPEILRGPRGLNGFGDFGAPIDADTQKLLDQMNAAVAKMQATEAAAQANRDASAAAAAAFANRSNVLTPDVALNLMYRASTTGVPTSELDYYGGAAAVKAAAQSAGYTGTPQNIQTYEIQNNIFESASTLLNKEFIGAEGEAKFAQLEANLVSQNEAVAAQARAEQAARVAAADAAFAAAEDARRRAIAEAYAVAQAAAAAAAATRTQATLAQRERALVAVRALYLQVLEREGDQAGLDYFADRFGDVIDPDELQIFTDMSQAEIQARDQYLADMAASAKGLADLATAQAAAEAAQAASLAADAARAGAVVVAVRNQGLEDLAAAQAIAIAAVAASERGVSIKAEIDRNKAATGGGINPALILAAAAAAFFIGG